MASSDLTRSEVKSSTGQTRRWGIILPFRSLWEKRKSDTTTWGPCVALIFQGLVWKPKSSHVLRGVWLRWPHRCWSTTHIGSTGVIRCSSTWRWEHSKTSGRWPCWLEVWWSCSWRILGLVKVVGANCHPEPHRDAMWHSPSKKRRWPPANRTIPRCSRKVTVSAFGGSTPHESSLINSLAFRMPSRSSWMRWRIKTYRRHLGPYPVLTSKIEGWVFFSSRHCSSKALSLQWNCTFLFQHTQRNLMQQKGTHPNLWGGSWICYDLLVGPV